MMGAVSSDQLEDGRVVSGAGGQHDLVAMAHALADIDLAPLPVGLVQIALASESFFRAGRRRGRT